LKQVKEALRVAISCSEEVTLEALLWVVVEAEDEDVEVVVEAVAEVQWMWTK
jgi:hypothetical protein